MKAFKFIDLCAGIGGFRLGMEKAGGECVFSCEIDKHARKTYAHNFGEDPQGDITTLNPAHLPDYDILCAGFPCQPFSAAGNRKGFDDKRGDIIHHIAEILRVTNPRGFVLENVPGLLTHDDGETFKAVLEMLSPMYAVDHAVFMAKDWGLPQKRKRLFIIGTAKWHKPASEAARTWGKWHGGLRTEAQLGVLLGLEGYSPKGCKVTTVEDCLLSEQDICEEKYVLKPETVEYLEAHRARHEAKGNGFGYRVIDRDDPNALFGTLVVGGMGRERNLVAHTSRSSERLNDRLRYLTPREYARIQGFPDNYQIVVSDSQAYKQFANAVPPPLVASVGRFLVHGKLGYVG